MVKPIKKVWANGRVVGVNRDIHKLIGVNCIIQSIVQLAVLTLLPNVDFYCYENYQSGLPL